jgi:hypothetical protein
LLWKLCRGSPLCRKKNDFNRCTVHHLNLLKVTCNVKYVLYTKKKEKNY